MTAQAPVVVVGIDLSQPSHSALQFAVDFAETFSGAVVAAHAWSYPWWMATPIGAMKSPGEGTSEVRGDAKRKLTELVETIDTDVAIVAHVGEGRPTDVLAEKAASADLLVLGAHTGTMTASTAHKLAGEVGCPIAVVPDDYKTDDDRRIVVGLDGSPDSVRAFRWAVDHAGSRPIAALRVWNVDVTGGVAPISFDESAWRAATKTELEATLDEVMADIDTDVDVTPIVDGGDSRSAVRRQGEDASMLVIGAKGHGAVTHFLLGSVASAMAAYPPCTTVVVPSPEPKG